MFPLSAFLAASAILAAPIAFNRLDVEAVQGRPVVVYRPVELGERPVRPVRWETRPPADIRYGLATVGPVLASALAVAWSPGERALWLDADGNGRLDARERHLVNPSRTLAIHARVATEPTNANNTKHVDLTILIRPGLLGGAPRYAVRGAMAGRLALGDRDYRVLLADGNADGCVNTPGTDRVWIDLDGNGRFDPVTERYPLGTPIPVGHTSFTIATDAWATAVAAHERDTRTGAVVLRLGLAGQTARFDEISASLISDTGELATIDALDQPREVTVGQYRLSSILARMHDASGKVWTYSFQGGVRPSITVDAGKTATARMLEEMRLDVAVVAVGPLKPGDDIDVTPTLRLGSGLYLSNCTTQTNSAVHDQSRTATILLKATDGSVLDRAVSGFACGTFCTHSVRVPATAAAGSYAVEVIFDSGPLAGPITAHTTVTLP